MKQVSVNPPERQRPRESRDDRAPEFGTLCLGSKGDCSPGCLTMGARTAGDMERL